MKENIISFVMNEFNWAVNHGVDLNFTKTACYGAVQYVLSVEWDEELANWWNDTMLPAFNELI